MIERNYRIQSFQYDIITILWPPVRTYFALLSVSVRVLAGNIHLFIVKLFIEKLLDMGDIAVFLRIYHFGGRIYAINYTFSNLMKIVLSAIKLRYQELRGQIRQVSYLGK